MRHWQPEGQLGQGAILLWGLGAWVMVCVCGRFQAVSVTHIYRWAVTERNSKLKCSVQKNRRAETETTARASIY